MCQKFFNVLLDTLTEHRRMIRMFTGNLSILWDILSLSDCTWHIDQIGGSRMSCGNFEREVVWETGVSTFNLLMVAVALFIDGSVVELVRFNWL